MLNHVEKIARIAFGHHHVTQRTLFILKGSKQTLNVGGRDLGEDIRFQQGGHPVHIIVVALLYPVVAGLLPGDGQVQAVFIHFQNFAITGGDTGKTVGWAVIQGSPALRIVGTETGDIEILVQQIHGAF